MQSSNSCFDQNFNTLQCCFIPFFSQRQIILPSQERNTEHLAVPMLIHPPINFTKSSTLVPHQQKKASLLSIKRSISSLKQKQLFKNRSSLDTQQNIPVLNLQLSSQKHKNSLKNSNAMRRYFSPEVPPSSSFQTFLPLNKERSTNHLYERKQLYTGNIQQRKSHSYFNKQSVFNSIQFAKSSNSNIHYVKVDTEKSQNPKIQFFQNLNKNEISYKPWDKMNIQSTATHFGHTQRSKNSSKLSQPYKVETSRKPQSQRHNPQEINKQTRKIKVQFNQNDNKVLKKSSLQKILQQKKQENHECGQKLYVPLSHFKHIQSFVEVSKSRGTQGQQKPYESIKTKGRPVQSMLELTKDLAKTKKMKKNKRKQQPGLNELQNLTVTSEYDDEQGRTRVEKIEESAVLLNFFNPPKDIKDRLELSKYNRPINGRSGFY